MKTNWNVKGKQYRQEKVLERISQISTMITKAQPFNSSLYEFCKSCTWDKCPGLKSRLENRMQGFNNALQKLNDYLSVSSDGPEIVQASSGGVIKEPYNLPGIFSGALNGFP